MGGELNMDEFGLARRIWRVIYPTLLYLLLSGLIGGIIAAVQMVLHISAAISAGETFSPVRITEFVLQYITDNLLLISLYGYIAALAVFVPVWFKTKARYPRWNGGKFSIHVALCSVGAAIGIYLIISLIITVTGLAELVPSYDNIIDAVMGGSLPLRIIAVGLAAPVAEELCFRGITLSRMSGTKLWLALAVQAVLFGILHMNILQSSYAALLGLFLGFLTIRYRNIIYAIIAHIAFNMFSILLGTIESELVVAIIAAGIIVVTVISVIGLVKCKGAEPYVAPEETPVELEGAATQTVTEL